MLWGDQARKELGVPFPLLVDAAQRPIGDLKHNRGIVGAATDAGITGGVTGSVLPPSFGTIYAGDDAKSKAAAQRVTPLGMKTVTHRAKGLL
jgi:hypothetical protein